MSFYSLEKDNLLIHKILDTPNPKCRIYFICCQCLGIHSITVPTDVIDTNIFFKIPFYTNIGMSEIIEYNIKSKVDLIYDLHCNIYENSSSIKSKTGVTILNFKAGKSILDTFNDFANINYLIKDKLETLELK